MKKEKCIVKTMVVMEATVVTNDAGSIWIEDFKNVRAVEDYEFQVEEVLKAADKKDLSEMNFPDVLTWDEIQEKVKEIVEENS